MHTRITQLISDLPDQIRARIALMDDSLIVSDEIQGNMAFINFASNLAVMGIKAFSFVPPSRFDAEFSRYASRSGIGDNEVQQLAIDLIARGFKAGATDIHIADMGTHVRTRFRVLGLLRDDMEFDAETGRHMIRTIYEHLGAAQDAPAFDPISRLDGRIINRDYLRKACTLFVSIPNLLNAMGHLTARERLCRYACCMTRRVLPAVWKRDWPSWDIRTRR